MRVIEIRNGQEREQRRVQPCDQASYPKDRLGAIARIQCAVGSQAVPHPMAPGEINVGEAAHICAAAPGGPRYDGNMTSDERRGADNGIWLCDVHARAVDLKDLKFTVEELQEWKRLTNINLRRSVIHKCAVRAGHAGADARRAERSVPRRRQLPI